MNAYYSKGLQAFLEGSINWMANTIKVALVKPSYVPDLVNHQFYSDLTPATNVIGTPQVLVNKTSTGGVADADDVVFSAEPAGSTGAYLVVYMDTGTATTSRLICLIDTGTGLPVATNGSDITVTWNSGPTKIFKL